MVQENLQAPCPAVESSMVQGRLCVSEGVEGGREKERERDEVV